MRKRREKPETSKPMFTEEEREEEEDEERGKEANGFFACYLLASGCPRYKGHTYIGFTVNPKRRIRQHNGEIGSGAWRTKRKRPWEMVLCIYGFPTNVSALQFEWAWQHPNESLAVRNAASSFKSLSGIANKVKLAYTMLTLPAWCSLNITVNYFSTKYMKNAAGCPTLPEHMKVNVCPINELPCYPEGNQTVLDNEDDWEYPRECEEACSFPAHGSMQEEISNEMAEKQIDNGRGTYEGFHELHGSAKELEVDELEPPTRTPPITSVMNKTEVINEESDKCQFETQQPPSEKKSTSATTTDISRLLNSNYGFPSEYEVIDLDLSTPSPDCRTSSHRYKRRVTTVRSEIIDLTKSPNFIQL